MAAAACFGPSPFPGERNPGGCCEAYPRATCRQQIVEVPSPAGRVQARTELANRRPIQDRLNATAKPAGRLRLGAPDRLQHLHYKRRIDGGHRQTADERMGALRKGCPELLVLRW